MRILMVCLGNICRSPLAEGIMRHKIEVNQLDWEVDSAGTGSWHIGEAPDTRSIAIARKHGLDISHQTARQVQVADLETFDLILTMDSSNYRDVLSLAQNEAQQQKVNMILNYAFPESDESVPDPYWDSNGFAAVFQMLEEACEQIVFKKSIPI
ncbi:MAG TPA: low molecular weight protein-tyrosine-phosphatase [Saprospiraceae bacterium]|nr:low molecular weight protein-tyrosine-phosphatase [Saprospiraceae bacterium]HMQ84096.1 low molecular weight protein-tyrosine-phosphatase [Saprospiraceae bacterium]